MQRILSGNRSSCTLKKMLSRMVRVAPALARLSNSGAMQVRLYTAPVREIKFLMDDVHTMQQHYAGLKKTNGEAATPEMLDMIITEMAKFAENELAPLNEGADSEGCKHLGPNTVTTPKGFKAAYDNFVAGGWQGLSFPVQYGGQGMPQSVALIATEMCATANWTWTMFPGLSKGAINTLLSHGAPALKEKYVKKMVSGDWTGTMCLTEPQCGSDLALVKTKAEPVGNGKYKITGTKIFISCGEHDLTDNIVHCVLARLPDAPEGTRGISLFSVSKFKIKDDGSLTSELNGATIGRIEHKMGCHGSPTCEINFENAEGELIGTANKGLNHMFTFINTSRMGTAVQGLAAAEGSYQNALAYARDRVAGRSLNKITRESPTGPAEPIINHPSVRQLLLFQKCIAEGGRSMVFDCAKRADCMEEAEVNGDKDLAKKIDDRLGFMTPILKGFLTEAGLEAASMGIQVYGGHGYIKSNKQEQILRDVRIASVWEGTTQIQALDLLGRKIMAQKFKPINAAAEEVRKQVTPFLFSAPTPQLRSHAWKLFLASYKWQYLALKIGKLAQVDRDAITHASVPFLLYSGYVVLGEHWFKMALASSKKLTAGNLAGSDAAFYDAKLKTADFYFENVFPRTDSLVAVMNSPLKSVMALKPEHFSFN